MCVSGCIGVLVIFGITVGNGFSVLEVCIVQEDM